MQKISTILSILFIVVFVLLQGERISAAEEEQFGYEIKMVKGKPFAVTLRTDGKRYVVMSTALKVGSYIAYFAAQDFTHRKEMIMNEFKEVKVVVDKEDVKGIKTVISLKTLDNKIVDDYELIVSLQIKRGYPCLAVYSKLVYKGKESAQTGFNWGIIDGFRYYAYPEGGKVKARKLEVAGVMKSKATKLGKGAYPWVWPTSGKGDGLGIMTVGMLAKNPLEEEAEIVISDVPPKKKLASGEFMDVPFILLPTTRKEGGYKPMRSLYERVKNLKWEMEEW
ncbi:MAG TPA: hypothetical protein EYP78_06055 [Candidatus Omnitrophica bacterium]|nr:hypothetical protein [Candidatus Omnitrophota bacterium]